MATNCRNVFVFAKLEESNGLPLYSEYDRSKVIAMSRKTKKGGPGSRYPVGGSSEWLLGWRRRASDWDTRDKDRNNHPVFQH